MVNILVTGGAGYIGSHVVRLLHERGDTVVVVDDCETGDESRVSAHPVVRMDLAAADAADRLEAIMREHAVEAVIHLAARKQVGESVERPLWYYQQNLGSLVSVLAAMQSVGVERLVFSSTAAVYGMVDGAVGESHPTHPLNPYGETKLTGEWMIAAATKSFPLAAVSLRFFNVAGAGWPELGDRAALNLVPMVFERLDAGEAPIIFGDDYATPDGTCVRDYVHVLDVAGAHLATLDNLDPTRSSHRVYNVGGGEGSSVRAVIDEILAVSGHTVSPVVHDRRPGDPATVVAAPDSIAAELGWKASHGLREIIASAWESHEYFAHEG